MDGVKPLSKNPFICVPFPAMYMVWRGGGNLVICSLAACHSRDTILLMYIQSLSLRHFRTYARLELDLPAAPILLLGDNAQGKTSLLEAIAYLALGRSPLTPTDQHLIHWNAAESGLPFAHLEAQLVKQGRVEQLEIAMERSAQANGNARTSKRVRIDRRVVRRADLAGHLNVVLFLPEDVGLIGGPPALRRRDLDDLLSQVYPAYVDCLDSYQQTLTRCNALLRHLRDDGGDPAQIEPLEDLLARHGVALSLYRRRVIAALSFQADRIHQDLTGGQAWLQLTYQPNFDPLQPPALDYQLGLLPQAAAESPVDVDALQGAYREMLHRRRKEAVARGMILLGPHRDELRFISLGVDLGTFGSRGQQRTTVLALRMAQLRWLQQETGETPVLLLDEVLAELDRKRRGYLLETLHTMEQTIMATTDAELFPAAFRERALVLEVSGGIITPHAP